MLGYVLVRVGVCEKNRKPNPLPEILSFSRERNLVGCCTYLEDAQLVHVWVGRHVFEGSDPSP